MALLGYDHLGLGVSLLAALSPALVAFVELLIAFLSAASRLRALEIILLPIDEHHDIGVLLDRTRLTEIGELRALVLTLLDGSAELGEGDDGDIQLFSQSLEPARDFRDFLDAVFLARLTRWTEKLEIVDDQQAETARALEAARTGAQRRDRQCGRVVDVKVQVFELSAHRYHAVEIATGDLALTDFLGGDACLFRQDAVGELLGRHFEGEEAHDRAVDDLGLTVVAMLLAVGFHRVEGDVGGECGLSHRRTAGQDQQIRLVQAAEQLVELGKACGDARELARAIVGGFGRDHRLGQRRAERPEAAIGLADAREVIEFLFRDFDLLDRGLVQSRLEGAVDDVLA